MPNYAPDLVNYLVELGDEVPTQALEDPEMLRRALSSESPISLVGLVAQELKDVDGLPVVQGLSTYERARVMTALGRKEDAKVLYLEVLDSADRELRGSVLLNLAGMTLDKDERKRLLEEAVDAGNMEALVVLGRDMLAQGNVEEGISILFYSIRERVLHAIPFIIDYYMHIFPSDVFERNVLGLVDLARIHGLGDISEAPFVDQAMRILHRNADGRVENVVGKITNTRRVITQVLAAGAR